MHLLGRYKEGKGRVMQPTEVQALDDILLEHSMLVDEVQQSRKEVAELASYKAKYEKLQSDI